MATTHRRSGRSCALQGGLPGLPGRFELAAGALRLAIGASSRTTFYSFTCPECGAAVRKPAGERIVELLTGGGVRTLRLHAPARGLRLGPCSGRCSRSLWVSWVSPCSACSPSGSSWRRSGWAGRSRESARRINRAAEDLERRRGGAARAADAAVSRSRSPCALSHSDLSLRGIGRYAAGRGPESEARTANREYAQGLPRVYP